MYDNYLYSPLFRPEINIEKEPEQSNISNKYLKEKTIELNEIKEEEERKRVEEKRLQLFMSVQVNYEN